jgi:hypothetical protein
MKIQLILSKKLKTIQVLKINLIFVFVKISQCKSISYTHILISIDNNINIILYKYMIKSYPYKVINKMKKNIITNNNNKNSF